ncbi:TIGR02757 family protein [Leptospira interrogans]|uniref:TIGR02757 family protein n=17 Tax=Leptospira interrogans TaxID=173 RepID=Q8F7U6_LEPIN|nr:MULTISPECIES: TIGR02757 family protein [Leptospira]APH42567.1 TIGR02757 family protein [Leptospira interrogans serovar Copenhageni/Icterohaemorrhagiae]EMF42719.1 TIGR02757 family protein [Leptospira interrogans serovar Lora str. TE 1992]EMG10852.1 TIGR02757 family protein [Leptospira interrogans serovar Grippotyphosa str. LT2186]EMG21337.1 TIGR02757 family protein [Leptospira interrogans serovar Copenhageni str. LT2050]EMM97012.1 TIGR02757 family protein [Leptospira interrogans serovar Zano
MNRSSQKIKRVLENLFLEYQTSDYLRSDPVEFPHLFSDLRDREISGFISALFSYGNITAIKDHLKRIFAICGNSPYRFLLNEDLKSIRKNLKSYRFQKPEDTYLFLQTIQNKLRTTEGHGLESLFSLPEEGEFQFSSRDQKSFLEGGSLRRRILSFQLRFLKESSKIDSKQTKSYGYKFLVGQGIRSTSLKRYSMFLRWMVRKEFPDFGIYSSISPSELQFPLDVHIQRIASVLNLSSRRSSDWKKAEEVTDFFRAIFPDDPVKADFALSRLGILKKCKSKYLRELCESCGIRSICKVYEGFSK